MPLNHYDKESTELALQFMDELIDSVESLTVIAEVHGSRSLADLFYLQQAILKKGFIDHYPEESFVLDIAKRLPSGAIWSQYIKIEYMDSPMTQSAGV